MCLSKPSPTSTTCPYDQTQWPRCQDASPSSRLSQLPCSRQFSFTMPSGKWVLWWANKDGKGLTGDIMFNSVIWVVNHRIACTVELLWYINCVLALQILYKISTSDYMLVFVLDTQCIKLDTFNTKQKYTTHFKQLSFNFELQCLQHACCVLEYPTILLFSSFVISNCVFKKLKIIFKRCLSWYLWTMSCCLNFQMVTFPPNIIQGAKIAHLYIVCKQLEKAIFIL